VVEYITVSVVTAALVWLVLAAPAAAPTPPQSCAPLQVRNPDGNYVVPGVQGDIPYTDGLALDAYVQQDGGRRLSVVVVHGGAWRSGSRSAHVGQILELLTHAGYNWFSVDYRLRDLDGYRESLADLRAALAFIRCRAADFGVDPSQLVLLGEDSGAHLAAMLTAERPAGVAGAILLGGFYDLPAVPALAKRLPGELLAAASPAAPRALPVLVVHGGADSEVPIDNAREYCSRVTAAGGKCQFVDVPGASHRAENWWPSQWGYKREIASWLTALSSAPVATHAPRKGTLEKDVVYNTRLDLKLDAYVPRGSKPVPAVIVVHGGGWEAGDKVTYVTPILEPLARAGLAWFSIDYRLTPDVLHEDQLDDLRQAIRFVRAQHVRFNVDPKRIFLLGESASGQMVSLMATEDSSLAGVISFYGVYDFLAMVTDASPRSLLTRLFRRSALDDGSRAILRKYSPLHQAHKNMPPMLLVNGTGERLWTQAQAFAQRLAELPVQHEVIALDGAPHGMENWEGHQEWMAYKRQVVDWIRRHAR
jgi:acetyl esterase